MDLQQLSKLQQVWAPADMVYRPHGFLMTPDTVSSLLGGSAALSGVEHRLLKFLLAEETQNLNPKP